MIHLDFETFSLLDLSEVGAYRYAEDLSTEVLIIGYGIGTGDIRTIAPPLDGYGVPDDLAEALRHGYPIMAHNVQFERCIWEYVLVRRYGWPRIPLSRWRCTAARAASVGFPRGLDDAAALAGFDADHLKDPRGKKLIALFCGPRRPTKYDHRTRVLPQDDPDSFEEFREYCAQDVRVERALDEYLPDMHVSETKIFRMDMRINDTGMPVNVRLLRGARTVVKELEADIVSETTSITGGIRPTQRDKLIGWLHHNGCTLPALTKEAIDAVAGDGSTVYLQPHVRRVLELRIDASRASTKKLESIQACMSLDDARIRGAYLYAGAHTLRWSSKLVQLHNMIRGTKDPEEIAAVLDAFATGDADLVRLLYDRPMLALSRCMRAVIAATDGHLLEVVDYSQIEARNLDWHAGNEVGLEEWRSGLDKYKLMATRMFGVSIEDVTDEQRRLGKNATLGCGFGMSDETFLQYCHANGAPDVTLDDSELAVGVYREHNETNVLWWREVETYAKAAIANPGKAYELKRCVFEMVRHWLTIKLPSGRRIWYPYARLRKSRTKYGKIREGIVFRGPHHEVSTYGAKLVENIVQATSRDIMINGIINAAEHADRTPVGHTHDEGIFETPRDKVNIKDLERVMCVLPPWAEGMPLEAKGFVTPYYRKD